MNEALDVGELGADFCNPIHTLDVGVVKGVVIGLMVGSYQVDDDVGVGDSLANVVFVQEAARDRDDLANVACQLQVPGVLTITAVRADYLRPNRPQLENHISSKKAGRAENRGDDTRHALAAVARGHDCLVTHLIQGGELAHPRYACLQGQLRREQRAQRRHSSQS